MGTLASDMPSADVDDVSISDEPTAASANVKIGKVGLVLHGRCTVGATGRCAIGEIVGATVSVQSACSRCNRRYNSLQQPTSSQHTVV